MPHRRAVRTEMPNACRSPDCRPCRGWFASKLAPTKMGAGLGAALRQLPMRMPTHRLRTRSTARSPRPWPRPVGASLLANAAPPRGQNRYARPLPIIRRHAVPRLVREQARSYKKRAPAYEPRCINCRCGCQTPAAHSDHPRSPRPRPRPRPVGAGLGAALHRSGTFLGTKKNLELRWGRGKFEVQVRYAKGVSRDLPTLNTTRSIEELSHPS